MALNLADRVRETTTVTSTGPATLLGAVVGYQSFAVVGDGNTCFYTIADQQGPNWEVGIGTYSTTGPTLTRTTILSSSNSGSVVNFTSGTKDVFLTYPSEKSVYLDASSNVNPLGTISSGTWQGSTIAATYGGTGLSSYTAGDTTYYTSGTALSKLSIGTANTVYTSSGTAPQWSTSLNLAGSLTAATDSAFTSTGALAISKGTTAQQPASPVTGMIRYNTSNNQFEGYSGSSPAWKSIGGSALSNDTSTSTNLYPVFAGATSGTAENLYTSNAKLLYKPSTGELQASEIVASNGIIVNSQTISASYTIATGNSASSVGAITIASGVTVTVSSGSRWIII